MALDDINLYLYLGGSWVDVSSDVILDEPIIARSGNWEHGPTARVSQTGTMRFKLNNSAQNSGGVKGYYSPGHASVRSGFKHGIRVKLSAWLISEYPIFLGRLVEIYPSPGLYQERTTSCLAVDWMDELAAFQVREIDPQTDKRADELLDELVASMPTNAQPFTSPIHYAGTDVFPYAFYDIGPGMSGLALAQAVVQSDLGFLCMNPSGILKYHPRTSALGSLTLGDADIHSIVVNGTLRGAYNHVRTVVHPKEFDVATTVLWSQTGTALSLGASETREIFVPYVSADNELVFAGIQAGTGVTPVATTDYIANTLADGTGTDKTADVTVTATYFATVAKLVVTNGATVPVYLTHLQVRGKGIYDEEVLTFEDSTTKTYGFRQLDFDLPYQVDGNIGQAAATYLLGLYEAESQRVEQVTIIPSSSLEATLIAYELGNTITISESITGISSYRGRLMGIEFEVHPNNRIHRITMSVEPLFEQTGVWVLDTSLLGTTTVLGLI